MTEFDKKYWQTIGPLGFPQQDRQAQQLDEILKKLPHEKEYQYHHAVVTKSTSEVNFGERSDVSWISTEAVDRHGEVVLSKGMNASQFQMNPLVTLQHLYSMPPVGKSLWQKRVKDGEVAGIKAKTQYPAVPSNWNNDDPWPPDKVFSLVQAGLLSGKSIGFLPTKLHFADEKEAIKNGWAPGTPVFDEWLLLEYSCVFLPANQEALVQEVSKGMQLDPWLMQQLQGILDGDFWNLMQTNKKKEVPAKQVKYFSEDSVREAIEKHLGIINWEAIVTRATEDAINALRGRV